MPSQCTKRVNWHNLKSEFVTLITGSSPVAAIWERPSGSCTASGCFMLSGRRTKTFKRRRFKEEQKFVHTILYNFLLTGQLVTESSEAQRMKDVPIIRYTTRPCWYWEKNPLIGEERGANDLLAWSNRDEAEWDRETRGDWWTQTEGKHRARGGEEGMQVGEMWVEESWGSNGTTRKMSCKDTRAVGGSRGQARQMWKW